MKHYTLKNLDCADCALDIEKRFRKMKSTRSVSVNFANAKLILDSDDPARSIAEISKVHSNIVFDEITAGNDGKSRTDEKTHLVADIVLIGISITAYIMGLVFQRELSHYPFSWPEYAVFIFAYGLSGWKVLVTAIRDVVRGKVFDENFLMTLATVSAIVIHELPEAVGVMIFYRIGVLLQNLSLRRSRKSIAALLDLRPDSVTVKTENGLVSADPSTIAPGTTIVIKPGERIPLDGEITEGRSQVDRSALNGESVPVIAGPGDAVLAGTINLRSTIMIRVTKIMSESYISKVLEMTEQALDKKAKIEQFITRFARVYTPIVIGVALSIAIFLPYFVPGMNHSQSIYRALVLLVISCPCALVLSVPLGYFGGIGKASRNGILVKGSVNMDSLARTRIVVFDKTGTLTRGVFRVQTISPFGGFSRDDVIRFAALAETQSDHPIASSILEFYGKKIDFSDIDTHEEVHGQGVIAYAGGKRIIAGNDRLLHSENIGHDTCGVQGTVVHVAVEGTYAGYIVISDELKPDARAAVAALRKEGISSIHLLTGDGPVAAEKTAADLGLDGYHASLLPDEKVTEFERIIENEHGNGRTAFVGDGINDAPTLARADVGIAMGELGTDAAIESADVVLATDSPVKVAQAIRIARKTQRIVYQNIVFALVVKLVFIIFGTAGLSGMWEAVFADMGVSIIAIFNAMRVLR